MFARFGFVSGPMVFIFLKGFFTFMVQIALYLRGDIRRGRSVIREKMDAPQRLNEWSIVFQTIGLTSTAFAYAQITVAAQPWASWCGFQTWSLLVSQHMGTITLLVGLSSNLIAAVLIEDDGEDPVCYDERAVGRFLFFFRPRCRHPRVARTRAYSLAVHHTSRTDSASLHEADLQGNR